MKKFVFSTILIFTIALIFAACGSAPKKQRSEYFKDAPNWLMDGTSGAVCAVGAAKLNQYDPTRTFSLSQDRGRELLAKSVKAEVQTLLDDYWKESRSNEKLDYKAKAESIAQHFTNQVMRFTSKKGTWEAPDGDIYTNMCIASKEFADTFKGVLQGEGLSQQEEEVIEQGMTKMLERLEKKVEGQGESGQVINMSSGQKVE